MIRTILVFLLLANTLFGQDDPNSTLLFGDQIITSKTPAEGETWGERIGVGAVNAYDLRKQVDSLQEEVRRLTGENEALRAQLRATKQPEPVPAGPTATFYSWTGCESCPGIIADLTPFLVAGGWTVEKESTDFPADGMIYPWLKLCWADKCVQIRSKRGERMSRAWLTERMNAVLR